ncbi:MAG TPA: pyridoxamine 5'-phosphate oxidase family protein [Gemmatimonadaceae bacterium]
MKNASRNAPEFRDLNEKECKALLSTNHVGRIAYSHHDQVDIRPISYVATDEWLFGRTSEGDKLVTLRHNQWMAFGVDEIKGPMDWKSVIVRGTFYELKNEGSIHDRQLYSRAVNAIRTNFPGALTTGDPLEFRSVLFGISINSMSGRSCSSTITG